MDSDKKRIFLERIRANPFNTERNTNATITKRIQVRRWGRKRKGKISS